MSREHEIDPQEKHERELDALMEKYFHLDDDGVPQSSRELVRAVGESKILVPQGEQFVDHKYNSLKSGDELIKTNNLWKIFSPETTKHAQVLLQKLRELGDGKPNEARNLIELEHPHSETPLYALERSGDLRRALGKLDTQTADTYLQLLAKKQATLQEAADTGWGGDVMKQLADPEYQADERVREDITKKLYVILHELGVNTVKLDG